MPNIFFFFTVVIVRQLCNIHVQYIKYVLGFSNKYFITLQQFGMTDLFDD